MNKVYLVVWSHAVNGWVVASELAKRFAKATNSAVRCRTRSGRVVLSRNEHAVLAIRSAQHPETARLNPMHASIVRAFPLLLMTAALPVEAQTVLAAGQDVYANGLNLGLYNLQLGGDVTWLTNFTINSAARSNITIDGAGHTITSGSNSGQRLLSFSQNNSNISITNATIASQPFTGAQSGMFLLNTSNNTINMNLAGTTIRDIGPTDFNTYASADYGPIFSVRGGSNSVLNLDGGAAGLTFQGNHGLADQPGVFGLYGSNTVNFTGKVTFSGNWTANYGGALTVYEAAGETMTFAGETTFTNNHSSVFGGAIDFWGGASTMTYNGPVTFKGNYAYGNTAFSSTYPNHVNDQHSRGGAINIGYLSPGAGSVNLTTNGTALFDGNYVIESKTNFNALGGAVSAYGNGGNYNYFMNFNGPTTFSNNYVYSVTGSGFGGAIYYDSGPAAVLNLGGGSSLINNYAKTLGGAIYLQTGTINLKANGGDITFQGNRQAASFTSIGGGLFAPVIGSGTPNAIYLNGTGSLNMDASAGNFIHFYDPVASTGGASITVNKTGAGSVIFHGNSSSPGDPAYNSSVLVNTNVNGGTFALTDAVTYGNAGFGTFSINNGGTVQGENGSTLASQAIAINAGGSVAVNGGVFNLSANNGITSTAGRFTGFGSIVAPSISLSASAANISTVDVAGGNTLTLSTALTNAGGLNKTGAGTAVLTGANTYTGGTTVSGGILQIGAGGTTGSIVGNVVDNASLAFNRSDVVTFPGVISGTGSVTQMGTGSTAFTGNNTYTGTTTIAAGTLQLGLNTTSGSIVGPIVDNAALAINRSDSVTLPGVISGTGTLTQVGAGTTILTGNNTYTGTTTINAGTLQLGNGGTSGSIAGPIVDNTALIVNRSDSVTLPGVISGAGALTQAGTGTTILTGNNTYTGTTTISAGALQLGNGGTSGSIVGNVTDNGSLIFNRSDAVTYGGVISGTGSTTKTGAGVLTLTAANAYAGPTNINQGVLAFSNPNNLGAAGNSIVFNGGTLRYLASAFGFLDRPVSLLAGGGTLDSNGFSTEFRGVASGVGGLTKIGAGTITLTNTNTYTGVTTINGGALQLGNGGTTGSIAGDVVDNASLIFDRSNTQVFAGAISGTGSVTQSGTGTTILSAANTYTGGTTISAGTLQIGNNNFTGSIVGNVLNNSALVFDRTNFLTYAGVISGTGSVAKNGTGTLILTGASTYTGATQVNAGTLRVSGSIASPDTHVLGGATLSGTGTVGGNVNIDSGGHLAPGSSPGTLTITGNLTLLPNSILDYELGQAGVPGGSLNDLTSVGGNLVLDGILNVNVSTGGTFGPGVYRLINYNGTLTNNGLSFGTVPAGFTPNVDLQVQTAVPQQVNLINAQALGPLTFWDGSNSALYNNNVVNGGSGTWLASPGDAAWTSSNGAVNAAWQANGFAIFQGTPGTVTVDNSAGAVTFSGAQFAVNGYTIAGAPLTTTTADTIIRVGDGTAAGAGMSATIGAVIQGSGGLDKTDLGTLVLTADNTYTGGTTIGGGTLQIGNGGTTGSVAGNITDNAALVFNRSNSVTYGGIVSGTGTLTQAGTGTTILTGDNTYTGTTTISAGTLQLGNGGTTGSVAGNITDNAALVFNRTGSITYGGVISGTGHVTQAGSGLIFTGNNTYTGGTTISSGTLQIGAGGTTGSIVGDIANASNLSFNRSDSLTYAGAISGAGDVLQQGTGTTILTGNSTYAGGTFITAGTLQIGAGGTSGSVGGFISNSGALVFERSDFLTFSGAISGTGTVAQSGTGTLALSGANTYGGGTTINAGTLSIAADNNLGTASGSLTFNAGTLLTTAGLTSARAVTVAGSGTIDNGGNVDTFSGVFSGAGSLTATGSGTTILTGTNTYTGGTTINGGALQIGAGGTAGSIVGNVVDNASLIFNRSDAQTFAGVVSGTGSVTQAGTGTTILTGSNTYSGGTTISAGTLQLGNGGTSGSVTGNITDNAALVFNRSDAPTFGGVIGGSGTLEQRGPGTLTLTGTNSYGGATTVSAGTLLVNGNQTGATGAVSVASGATLGGIGTTGGNVAVADGGHLQGSQGQSFAMNTLALNPNSQVDVTVTAPGTIGVFNINGNGGGAGAGNLTLDGNLNVTAAGSLGPGVYRVMSYSGALTNNGMAFGTVPAGFTPNVDLFIQTSVAQQVNLVNAQGVGPLNFWDGNNSALFNNGQINGGSGTWLAAPGNDAWSSVTGALNAPWQGNGFAVFQATPGTVTVDNSAGAVTFSGAQFAVDGYTIAGAPLTTTTPDTIIRVGDGSAAGAAMSATISAAIQGTGGLDKTDLGTLVLSGTNTYSGGTTVGGGVLSIGSDANLGAANTGLTLNGGTLLTTGAISSPRPVTLGSLGGTINNGGNVDVFSSAFGGAGGLTVTGSGTVRLEADNTYAGGTTISAGTLMLGNGGATGSVTGNIVNNGALVLNRSAATTYAGTISGSGSLTSQTGTVTLTGANTYAGATAVNAGTLLINGNQSAATGAVSVASGAMLGGTGTTGGTVTVADNAHLVGTQGQVLTMNALTLSPLSQIDVSLSAPSASGLFNINGNAGGPGAGNLTLAGRLNITATGAFGPGVYRLMNYTGALTNNGLAFGTVPGGIAPNIDLSIQTAVPQQVNLINVHGANLTFWDGGNSALINNGQVNGGSGTWLAGVPNQSWTDSSGAINGPWPADGFAIFQGTPGTVTVDNSAGPVTFSGAQFAVDGYTLTGQPLTTTTPQTIIRVGDGTAAGAAMTATIGAVIQGTGGLDKTDLGKLVLTGNNTYTGGTTISSGVLQIGNGGNSGSVVGDVANNGALVFNRADAVFQDGIISGTGSVTQAGSGKLVFNGIQPYSGATHVIAGTLVVGDALHTSAQLSGGGLVTVEANGSLGGYGKVSAPVVNRGLIGVGNALPALANGPDAVFTIAGNLDNRGTITMNNGVAGDQLIVTGGTYVSNGGRALIDTVLNEGGANAQSDKLATDATAVGAGGPTRIAVHPVGAGQGAVTQQDGIRVVSVGNRALSASGAFVLDGRVVAGPYEYQLFRGGVSDPGDGQWYLRSQQPTPPTPPTPTPPEPPRPLYRPEIAAYLANQYLAGQMFINSLHDRLGEPQFVEGQGFDPARGDRARSGWLRMSGNWEGSRSADGNFKVNTDAFQMQGGAELASWPVAGRVDRLHVGVMGSYGTASSRAEATGNPARAKGTVEGWILGVYGTWYQNDEKKLGAYVDTWLQYGWFNNRVEGDQLPTVKYNAQGWSISGEVGYALPLRNDWVVEPQAQLIYVGYDENGTTEPNGTRVSGANANGVITRLGVRTYRTFVREDTRKVRPYVTVNWWHTSTDNSIRFNQVSLGNLYPSNRYEVKFGVNGEINKRWTGWANVSGAWGDQSFHQYALRVGVKYTW